jgi:hypothetical protein
MRKKPWIAFVAAATLMVALTAQVAYANHWSSRELVAAKVSQTCEGGVKIDDPIYGIDYQIAFGEDNGQIEFLLNANKQLTFQTNGLAHVVTSILIKGGPDNAVLYTYAPGTNLDSGLTAPTNPSNGKPYGVSHICVYTAKVAITTTTTTTTTQN